MRQRNFVPTKPDQAQVEGNTTLDLSSAFYGAMMLESGIRKAKCLIKTMDLAFTTFESTLGSDGDWLLEGSFFGSSKPKMLNAPTEIGSRRCPSRTTILSISNFAAFSRAAAYPARGYRQERRRRDRETRKGNSLPPRAFVAMGDGPGPDFICEADREGSRPGWPAVNRFKYLRSGRRRQAPGRDCSHELSGPAIARTPVRPR